MIVSRAEPLPARWALAVAFGCLAALAVPSLANAQSVEAEGSEQAPTAFNRPVNLLPDGSGDLRPEDATKILQPEPLIGGPRLEPGEAPAPSNEIEVNRLGSIDLEAVGTLDSGNGGLGRNMWRGSKRHVVLRLMSRLSDQIDSPSLRELAGRLLLSAAVPPAAQVGGPADSLLKLRIEHLAALGQIEGLEELLRVVPERNADESIQRARVEAYLLAGNADQACRSVRNVVGQGEQSLYWQKALVFCQIHAGEMAGAALGVGLLREQSSGDEDNFIALAEAASGGASDIPVIGNPSVFELSILQRLDASLADETAQEIHPGMLFAMARSPDLELERRIEVAEEAVALGVLPAADLGLLYSEVEIAEADLAAFRSRAVEWEGSRARALRYQAAMAAKASPKDKLDMIVAALDAAPSPQDYLAVARLYEPLLLVLDPSAQLSDFTSTAGLALFALGRFQKAEAWMVLARQEAMTTPTAAAAVTALWPYARLAGLPSVPWDGDLNAWISANQGEDPAALSSRVALLQIALRALGGGGPLDWSEIAASTDEAATEVPDASVLFALEGASGSGRLGETVLLSLLVLGKAGPGSSHLLALERVLTALSNVGLEREARLLAIEAALARGV